jgi:hypothetical protein
MDISPIDIACEALTVLRDLSNKALEELERRGGKLPDRPDTVANAGIRAAMLKFAEESITGIIAVSAGKAPFMKTAAEGAAFETFRSLMEHFRSDPRSRHSKLKYIVRENHDRMYAKLDAEVGDRWITTRRSSSPPDCAASRGNKGSSAKLN